MPAKTPQASEFRADLAGLLVVAIAASYEACIKDILISFATRHHSVFGEFATNQYSRLNSKITISDLNSYCKTFSKSRHESFKQLLKQRSDKINERLGQRIENHYANILGWRHAFAHSWVRSTTVEEVIRTHKFAIRIIYCFDQAFL